jgi:hypothetical protein
MRLLSSIDITQCTLILASVLEEIHVNDVTAMVRTAPFPVAKDLLERQVATDV